MTAETAEAHFDRCMAVYVEWMQRGDSHRLGWSKRDSVFGRALTNYMVSHEDNGHVADEGEQRYVAMVGQAVAACMESLFNFEANAVKHHYGLARTWCYPQYVQADCLRTGMKRLRELVAKRC